MAKDEFDDKTMSDSMEEEGIPIDSMGKAIALRDTLLIERQWDRVNRSGSKNMLVYENRAEFKSALLALEAYLMDILDKDERYIKFKRGISGSRVGTAAEEITKSYKMMGELKIAISNSKYAPVLEIDIDASDDERQPDIQGHTK